MKLLYVTDQVYEDYKHTVRNSENESYLTVTKKLTRNYHLATKKPREDRAEYCIYGRLHFIVNQWGDVVWLRNRNTGNERWEKDLKLYQELNEKLGLGNKLSEEELVDRERFHTVNRKINRRKSKIKDKIKDNGYVKLDYFKQ